MTFKNMLASKGKKKWYALIGVVAVLAMIMLGLHHAHATHSSSHQSNKQSAKSVSSKATKSNDQNQKTSNQPATDNTDQVKDDSVSAASSSTVQAQQSDTTNKKATGQGSSSSVAAPASQPAQEINKGNPRQTVMPNVNVYGAPGLCLQYVDDAFNISSNRSYSATASAGKASANGTMHYNDQFPIGVKVPVYWNLISKDDGVNYGHIAIWDGQGGFYWEGNHSSTPNYFTLDEMKQIMNGTRQVNGHYLTENWQTPSLIGWSTSLEGHTIAENL
ncbi:prolipoprotein diacylglyceryl transferase [Fructobacillus sp. EFB-N1]|uniref:hypothetical protein n=1 Tax=Fructobacillus sp. EFB-N1 TaxID=1658766 RepID=UPI00064DE919|nr:hypothetical protein [Fructobacillus sp. EFB-N1]KMK53637.1 prolipoprotein diacylglyceryl transferase [Fructobacillus sp. EFB-N1]